MEPRKFTWWQYAATLSLSLFSAFLGVTTSEVSAEEQSVVLIQGISEGEKSGSCASGILKEGKILTNAHVIDAVCPDQTCNGIKIARALSVGKPADQLLPCDEWSIGPLSRSADLGVLECKNHPIPTTQPIPLNSERATSVYLLSYPGCGTLQRSDGEITSQSGLLIKTTARGDYGSSGGGIFSTDGSLVAIVDQAASINNLLFSKITIRGTFQMRGIRSVHAKDLFTHASSLDSEVATLLQYYRDSIRVEKGIDRLFVAFDFLSRVEGLKRDAAANHSSGALALLSSSEYLRATLDHKDALFSPLSIATIIESKGLSWAPWVHFSPKGIDAFVSQFPEVSQKNIKELLEAAVQDPFPGVEISMIIYCIEALLIALVCGLVLGWLFFRIRYRRSLSRAVSKVE